MSETTVTDPKAPVTQPEPVEADDDELAEDPKEKPKTEETKPLPNDATFPAPMR